jgi:hypothetical protein
MNEYENEVVNETDVDSGAYEEPVQQEVAPQEEDWKARAIAAQTRLEMIEQMRNQAMQQAAPQRVDEVTRLRHEIENTRAKMPQLDDKDPQTFWDRERVKDQLDALQERLVEARIRQQERLLVGQQVNSSVQQYKAQQVNRAAFKAIEPQFDQLVERLEPHLKGNRTMLEMIRKNLEYDYMSKGKGPKAPSSAPSGAYQPQARANNQRGKVNWQSAADREIGEYYIQRGIINGPEDYYDPRFNERSAQANNNGVAIYEVPNKPRGWRR